MRSWIESQWSVSLPAPSDAVPSARQPRPERAARRVTYPFAYKVAVHIKNDRVVADSYLLEDSLALCTRGRVHHCLLRSNPAVEKGGEREGALGGDGDYFTG